MRRTRAERGRRKSVGGVGMAGSEWWGGESRQGSSALAALKRSTRGHCRRGRSYDSIERLAARCDHPFAGHSQPPSRCQSDTCSRVFPPELSVTCMEINRTLLLRR